MFWVGTRVLPVARVFKVATSTMLSPCHDVLGARQGVSGQLLW